MPEQCYPKTDLEAYLQGRIDDELSNAIELHLTECEACEDTVVGLDTNSDTLIRTLQIKSEAQAKPSWVSRLAANPDAIQPKEPQPTNTDFPSDDSLAKEAPRQLGDYELMSVLGRGGMSVVFSAQHKHLGREVAVKLLLPNQQQSVSRDRFAREMRAVGALNHPAIVRATDAGESGDTLYLVMDRVDGVDLNQILKESGPMPVGQACAIVRDVATGLSYAHERQIIHRDIKPSNIMLSREGQAKILDFGLARVQSSTGDVSLQTTMGQLLGTLDYMPPEQAGGQAVDERADVYGLGATLFKLLTGIPPHGRSSDVPIVEFLSRLATQEANRLDKHRNSIPQELVELVACMLRKDPADRVANMREVVERLEPFVDSAELNVLAETAIAKSESDSVQDLTTVHDSLLQAAPGALATDSTSRSSEIPKGSDAPTLAAKPNIWNWLPVGLGLASLGGIAALAIALTIDTPEGQIQIKSELENINVQVVDEKDRVEEILVQQGNAMTTVGVGRYRIRLDSKLDGIQATPDSVTVTKNNVFEVKVTKKPTESSAVTSSNQASNQVAEQNPKSETLAPSEKRDPMVAMQARVELEATIHALKEARLKPDENEDKIRQLEAKVTGLRSLSLPIPTQPVYQGRTLADWTAQMNYEKDHRARKTAAEAVVELSEAVPSNADVRTLLLAAAVFRNLFGTPTESTLAKAIENPRNRVTTTISSMPGSEKVEQLAAALRDTDPDVRVSGYIVCAELKDELKSDNKWQPVVDALAKESSKVESTILRPSLVERKLVYACCLADQAAVKSTIQSIDLKQSSSRQLQLLLDVATHTSIASRELQLKWLAHFVPKQYPLAGKYGWYPTAQTHYLEHGPLAQIASTPLRNQTREDINVVTSVLLDTIQNGTNFIHPDDKRSGRNAVADQFGMLMSTVTLVPPEDELREQTIRVLNDRLGHLLSRRGSLVPEIAKHMDSPAEVAATLTMLTGKVPESIMTPTTNEKRSPIFQYLGNIMSQLKSNRDRSSKFESLNNLDLSLVAQWYPWEVTQLLSGPDFPWPSKSTKKWLDQFELDEVLDPRLMIGFAQYADEFEGSLIRTTQLPELLERHPRLDELVQQTLVDVKSLQAIGPIYESWSLDKSKDQIESQLLKWLESGNAAQIRFSISTISRLSPVDFKPGASTTERGRRSVPQIRKDLQDAVAAAYDRLAELDDLEAHDFNFMAMLADEKSPNAPKHAGRFLVQLLRKPDIDAAVSTDPRRRITPVYHASRIFTKRPHPEHVDEIIRLAEQKATDITLASDQRRVEDLAEKLTKWRTQKELSGKENSDE